MVFRVSKIHCERALKKERVFGDRGAHLCRFWFIYTNQNTLFLVVVDDSLTTVHFGVSCKASPESRRRERMFAIVARTNVTTGHSNTDCATTDTCLRPGLLRSLPEMLISHRPNPLLLSLALGAMTLSGCGGDRKEQRGRFIDSAVQGAEYFTGDDSGLTDVDGGFYYTGRSTVRFAIGAVDLGEAQGDDIITPMDLADSDDLDDPLVLNRARLLLSLDADQIPSNGITIAAETRAAATVPIRFDQTLQDFSLDPAVIDLVNVAQENSNVRNIVSAFDARAHLRETLEGIQGNQQPAANAGPNQTVQSGETVYLCGRAGDADGTIVDFTWRQLEPLEIELVLGRPEFESDFPEDGVGLDPIDIDGSLTSCDAENLTQLSIYVVAPTVINTTTFNLEFSVEDDDGLKAYDTVQITVEPL
jgi:hypothetical protein